MEKTLGIYYEADGYDVWLRRPDGPLPDVLICTVNENINGARSAGSTIAKALNYYYNFGEYKK